MDEQTLLRAIEPFYTTKGVGKGTGLGLPMVLGMTEQSGGKLSLKSKPGEGTTAELCLPVALPKRRPNEGHRSSCVRPSCALSGSSAPTTIP